MPPIAAHWIGSRLLAEHLVTVAEPLALALRPGPRGGPAAVAERAARALLDLPEVAPQPPPWLAPHQVPALTRLRGVMDRYGGALLADAVGLGKSYIALAVALDLHKPFALVVPAVLVPQWRRLLAEKGAAATIITHETLSRPALRPATSPSPRLIVVDEAHRFRNPHTLRYRRLAGLSVGVPLLLVTATPVHNRLADLFHLFRLFLRDDALTALGLGSLTRAARGDVDQDLLARVASRLIVARSRRRAGARVTFPERRPGTTVRAGAAPDSVLVPLVRGITALTLGGRVAALLRLGLLRRLASSLPAFRATLARYRAFAELSLEAARTGRRLGAADFQRLFPRTDPGDIQLTLMPLVLPAGEIGPAWGDVGTLDHFDHLDHLTQAEADPKAEALEEVIRSSPGKTIVFTHAHETARYLLRRLGRRHRVAAVTGTSGWFGDTRATPHEVLAAFAPVSQGASPPPVALATDVLVATDLVSEGLNLQDAARVIHYDLPWSPARLAQRVGRIDRLGSSYRRIDTAAFLPPAVLDEALNLERRLAAKLLAQRRAGAAQREAPAGADTAPAALDWCDRLHALAAAPADVGVIGSWAQVRGSERAAVVVVRLGGFAEALVVAGGVSRATPVVATRLLEQAVGAQPVEADRKILDDALRAATTVVRARVAALESARWRAENRDRLARRLIPWVLTAARRAARVGNAALLARLDQLVTRLTLGMTAGEELSLHALLERHASLAVRDLLAWHERLPPVTPPADAPDIELIGAVLVEP